MVGEADNFDAVYGLSGEASVNARRDRPRHNRNTGSLAGRCWLNMCCMNMLIMVGIMKHKDEIIELQGKQINALEQIEEMK